MERPKRRGLPRSASIFPEDQVYEARKQELRRIKQESYRKDLEKKRNEYLEINQKNFFDPIEHSLSALNKALHSLKSDVKQALQFFQSARDIFPGTNLDLLFNDGKANVEYGDVLYGIESLYMYVEKATKGNYTRELLINALHLNEELTKGRLGEIEFEIHGSELFFLNVSDEQGSNVPLPMPYQSPINLQVQDRGIIPEVGQLSLLEFELLVELVDEKSNSTFEVRVPRKYIEQFLYSFIPVLQEYEFFYEFTTDIETLQFENYLIDKYDNLNMHKKTIYGPDWVDKWEDILSVAHITVPANKKELLIIEFSQFVERFILTQRNIVDALEERDKGFLLLYNELLIYRNI